jgi:hypothetical protein
MNWMAQIALVVVGFTVLYLWLMFGFSWWRTRNEETEACLLIYAVIGPLAYVDWPRITGGIVRGLCWLLLLIFSRRSLSRRDIFGTNKYRR